MLQYAHVNDVLVTSLTIFLQDPDRRLVTVNERL